MKLLFDQNISFRIISKISLNFPEAKQVIQLGIENYCDLEILEFAKENHPEVYEAYMNSPVTNTPADVFAKGHEVQDLGSALSLYDELWTSIKE